MAKFPRVLMAVYNALEATARSSTGTSHRPCPTTPFAPYAARPLGPGYSRMRYSAIHEHLSEARDVVTFAGAGERAAGAIAEVETTRRRRRGKDGELSAFQPAATREASQATPSARRSRRESAHGLRWASDPLAGCG
jgi:hypothetical protein